jgi:hypothetical protein
MAETAAGIQYNKETILGFEQRMSRLRKTVTIEAQVTQAEGGGSASAVFLVAGSGSTAPVTRGINGRIPSQASDLTQSTATLVEWHHLEEATSFNIETSQGNRRRIMQQTTLASMNRKIDTDILAALANTTVDTGAAQYGSLDLVVYALTILGNNDVENDGNIAAVITPAFHGNLVKTKEFKSAEYIGSAGEMNKKLPMEFDWLGVRFIVSTRITGKGTADELCYMYHKAAIGHACDSEQIRTASGYNEEQDYSFARTSAFMGSKLLQGTGIVQIHHNGANYAAQ